MATSFIFHNFGFSAGDSGYVRQKNQFKKNFILFFKIVCLSLSVYVYVYVCMCEYRYPERPEECIKSLAAWLIGSCSLPNKDPGNGT